MNILRKKTTAENAPLFLDKLRIGGPDSVLSSARYRMSVGVKSDEFVFFSFLVRKLDLRYRGVKFCGKI